MAGGGVDTLSDAALCSIQVSQSVLDQDLLLHLVLEILQRQTHQLSVVITKEHQLSMNVGGGYGGTTNSSHTLKQRNAILRSVVGPALHGAMDAPTSLRGSSRAHLCWSGGLLGASASIHGSSVRAAGNAAALIQWMSVADQIRKNVPEATRVGM
jgi:hypothetical protein